MPYPPRTHPLRKIPGRRGGEREFWKFQQQCRSYKVCPVFMPHQKELEGESLKQKRLAACGASCLEYWGVHGCAWARWAQGRGRGASVGCWGMRQPRLLSGREGTSPGCLG